MAKTYTKWTFSFVWEARRKNSDEVLRGTKKIKVRECNLDYKDVVNRAYVKAANKLIKRFGNSADIKLCLKPQLEVINEKFTVNRR